MPNTSSKNTKPLVYGGEPGLKRGQQLVSPLYHTVAVLFLPQSVGNLWRLHPHGFHAEYSYPQRFTPSCEDARSMSSTTSPTAPSPQTYFLKTKSLPTYDSPKYSGLYVRHSGSTRLGTTAISTPHTLVLTPGAPVYLKGVEEPDSSRIVYSYEGRKWGLVMNPNRGLLFGWQAAEMREGEGDEGFFFEAGETGEEVLKWKATGLDQDVEWRGWMACECSQGVPALIWFTSNLKKDLPAFCERVELVREYQGQS